MSEKRKFPRVDSKFALEVIPSDAGAGKSTNVSEGGLLFVHDGPINVGTMLYITLRVPGLSGSISVKARVLRCDASGSGKTHNVAVNFVDIDEDTEDSIKELLESF